MKPALFAVASLVSLFVAMFTALMLLALSASETFEGIAPSGTKVLILKTSSALFLILAIIFLVGALRNLKRIDASPRGLSRARK